MLNTLKKTDLFEKCRSFGIVFRKGDNKQTLINKIRNYISGYTIMEDASENRGTGAGGANTNLHGKSFKRETDNSDRLIANGYKRINNRKYSILSKTDEDKTTVFVSQSGLDYYLKDKYGLSVCRKPDEAYILEYNDGRKVIKILEKKEQRVEGSVETKLWSGPALKREYELMLGPEFTVHYGFCVNEYLGVKIYSDKKKYECLRIILQENNIPIMVGGRENYFDLLNSWIQ